MYKLIVKFCFFISTETTFPSRVKKQTTFFCFLYSPQSRRQFETRKVGKGFLFFALARSKAARTKTLSNKVIVLKTEHLSDDLPAIYSGGLLVWSHSDKWGGLTCGGWDLRWQLLSHHIHVAVPNFRGGGWSIPILLLNSIIAVWWRWVAFRMHSF